MQKNINQRDIVFTDLSYTDQKSFWNYSTIMPIVARQMVPLSFSRPI